MVTKTQRCKYTQKTSLDNGITLIVTENRTADIIAGKIFCRQAGSLWEESQQAGVFHLLACVMPKGTKNLSALEIAEKVESIGAALGMEASGDYSLVSIKTITEDFPEILSLAAEILRYPSFPPEEVSLEKTLTLQNILSQREQPFNLAFQQLREMIYGQHPYGYSILGTEETITNLTEAHLKSYHQKFFRPSNLVVSIAGNIDLETATAMVEEVFGDWQNPPTPPPERKKYTLLPHRDSKHIPQATQQTIIMMGYLAPEMTHPDYPVFKLLTSYLGNGLSSRLFVELREKRGLAYDVSAFYPTRVDKSLFVAYIGTGPQNSTIAQEALYNEIQRLRNVYLSEEEIKLARNKLLGQYALGKQTNAEFAQIFGWYETMGVGIEYDVLFPQLISAVTVEDIYRVANEYLRDEYLCVSIIGEI
ncbi:MAG: insulinase family protein [Geminocystis sp.]|nr:insulinase family protein [Geminocystis sp.]HIK37930.1 insulinase family protein [Geminocystis sp. M7585_C2015_104]MCS7147070.1 insulinase family protein [Geminocystis sp.]MCX8079282.1 insulinase family protein [Geminocystis sp.]MDW8115893.1 pitrilysin family protein [Geminocystis sp.]